MGLTSGNKEKKRHRCGWCDKKCHHYIYIIRTCNLFFGGAHGGRSSESVKTVYFCNYQHRINYAKEPK